MTISERIFHMLDKNNKSQKDLSDYTGIKSNTISDWKRKGTNPSADKIIRICDFLDVSVDWLLTGEGEMHRSRVPDQGLTPKETELLEVYRQLDILNKERIVERMKTIIDLQKEAEQQLLNLPNKSKPKRYHRKPDPAQVLQLYPELYIETEQVKKRVADLPASAGIGNYLDNDYYEELYFDADTVPERADFGVRITGDSMEPLIHDKDIVWVEEKQQIENGQIGIFILDGDTAYCKKLHIDHDRRAVSLVSLNKKYRPIIIDEDQEIRTVGRVLI